MEIYRKNYAFCEMCVAIYCLLNTLDESLHFE